MVGGAVLGIGSGLFAATFMLLTTPKLCPDFPEAELLFRMGCEIGSKVGLFAAIAAAGAIYGAYQGHKIALGR